MISYAVSLALTQKQIKEVTMKQTEVIKEHLDTWGSITPLEALQEYGIMRLASRINDLKKQGVVIRAETVHAKNRFGRPVTYARYRLVD